MDEWSPPPRFDEYRIVRPLGRGGMGRVFLGHDVLLDRPVAVKFIADPEPDARKRERFAVEGRALARLNHPNVAAVHRVGEVDGRQYLVAEFVRGQSLDQLQRPVPGGQVLRIASGLCRGLAAAHRQGILHRDLKPANAVLAEDGEVKLLDFGLAKFVGGEPASPRAPAAGDTDTVSGSGPPSRETDPGALTEERKTLGTPLYMAPEVLRGEPATRRSDLYSLGALLYELCAGAPPRPRGRWVDPPGSRASPLLQAAPLADPGLAPLLDRCLQTDPELRFASADELLDALVQLLPESRAAAVPKGNPYRGLQPFEAEHRALFFGRDADVRAVLERLRAEPLVIVAGDSGVGKSSLCKAGVLPLVEEEALGQRATVTRLVPGRHPLQALAVALSATLETNAEALTAWIRSDPRALSRALRQQQRPRPGETRLFFIDQLEELFTLADPEEARLFAEVVAPLSLEVPGAKVLATVRGDFFTRLAALPNLGAEVSRALFLLRPLNQEQIREAILGPARRKGVSFESEAMVDGLVSSAARAAGGLPLLEFALAELWDARDLSRGVIPLAALERIGGVEGALARHADEVLARLVPAQRQAARRLLLRLVTAEGTRARKTAEELGASDPDGREALEVLVRGRLLVAHEGGAGTTVEVAHEALLAGWGTLREWLEVDGDRRVLRTRVTDAAREWVRLGRSRDALWHGRQLEETGRLDPAELDEGARAFLDRSLSAKRRARWLRAALVLLAPLVAGSVVGFVRWRARAEVEERVSSLEAAARTELAPAKDLVRTAQARRGEAFRFWDQARAPAKDGEAMPTDQAERLWTQALEAESALEGHHQRAARSLEAALLLEPKRATLRGAYLDLLEQRIEQAKRRNQGPAREGWLRLLEAYDDDRSRATRLRAVAPLQLALEPPDATVEVRRYQDRAGRLVMEPVPGAASRGALALAAGSYLLLLSAPGRVAVRYPVLIEPGESPAIQVTLPLAGSTPDGFVYVPAGPFLFGSADEEVLRTAFDTVPLHRVTTAAFLIARHEVTFAQWVEFLDSLPAAERRLRTPGVRSRHGAIELSRLAGGWSLSLQPLSVAHRAAWGEPLHYPQRTRNQDQDWRRLPVVGISLLDARAYLAWLAATGRVRGARLCTDFEWERAAKGADDRTFTTGSVLEPQDANFDLTYARDPAAMGPDEVGAHPASESPFGVADLQGNAMEMVAAFRPPDEAASRGGAWYHDRYSAILKNRTPLEPSMRTLTLGLRVCADPGPPGRIESRVESSGPTGSTRKRSNP